MAAGSEACRAARAHPYGLSQAAQFVGWTEPAKPSNSAAPDPGLAGAAPARQPAGWPEKSWASQAQSSLRLPGEISSSSHGSNRCAFKSAYSLRIWSLSSRACARKMRCPAVIASAYLFTNAQVENLAERAASGHPVSVQNWMTPGLTAASVVSRRVAPSRPTACRGGPAESGSASIGIGGG